MAALGAGVDAQLSLEHRAVAAVDGEPCPVDAMVVGADAEGVFDPRNRTICTN